MNAKPFDSEFIKELATWILDSEELERTGSKRYPVGDWGLCFHGDSGEVDAQVP